MHKLHELKEKLIAELEDYSENGKFSKDDVEAIKYMASAVDHLCNIVERDEDDEYSMAMGGGSYAYNGSRNYRGYRNSYARARNPRRDNMGRYSRGSAAMVEQLRDMMDDAPDERTRQEIQRLMTKMEQMHP